MESGKEIQITFTEEMRRVNKLKQLIKENTGDVEETLRIYGEIRSTLESLQSKIESLDYTKGEKAFRAVTGIGSLILLIGSLAEDIAVQVATKNQHLGDTIGALGTIGAGLTASLRFFKKSAFSKESALNMIRLELKSVNKCIELLKNPGNYVKAVNKKYINDDYILDV